MKQVCFLCWVLDVGVNKMQIHFTVDVCDCNLKAIEASDFQYSYLVAKLLLKLLLTITSKAAKKARM